MLFNILIFDNWYIGLHIFLYLTLSVLCKYAHNVIANGAQNKVHD